MVLIFFSKKPLVRRPSKDAKTRKQLDEKVGSTMKISFVSFVIRGIATARTEFCRLRKIAGRGNDFKMRLLTRASAFFLFNEKPFLSQEKYLQR
jgi:hypothetical protein